MKKIYISGHKNPDTDSAVAAYCYAKFKSKTDPSFQYIPAVCGTVNAQTKFIFEKAKAEIPVLLKDVYPRVIDVARKDGMRLYMNEPVFEAVKDLDENTLSVIPVFGEDDKFSGIVGIHEIVNYMMTSGKSEKQRYTFSLNNIEAVIPGKFHKRGNPEEFSATIMIGAMDLDYLSTKIFTLKDKPLLVVGKREKIIQKALEYDLPAIILTNVTDNSYFEGDIGNYKGSIYLSQKDTAETIRLLWLSAPIKHIANTNPFVFQHDDLFDDAKKILLSSELRGVAVLEDGKFAGVVTRRSFIEKPRKKIILVDHNEITQSVNGAAEAEICEIIDHHRLAAEKTITPIYIFSKPVGSTSTLVYQHHKIYNVPIDLESAELLLAGILADTLFLKSPTTTADDIIAAQECASAIGADIKAFGSEIMSKMPLLKNADPEKTVNSDLKVYTENSFSFGISQIETVALSDLTDVAESFLQALESLKNEKHIDSAMLLVTDVIHGNSKLIITDWPKIEENLIYKKESSGLYDLPGILSRKKQLLPEILRCLT